MTQQPGDGRTVVAGPVLPHTEPAATGGHIDTGHEPEVRPFKRWLGVLGPGLITGASDADPSGIGTHAVAGASLGFATLWTTLVTFPLMAVVQFICAKIGMVSGRGLAGVLRQHYPRWLLYPVVSGLVIANTVGAGADIGAIAAGINLLVPIPARLLIVPVALLILALQIFGSYRLIAKAFKWLTLTLLAYVAAALFAKPELRAVARGTLVPAFHLDQLYLATLVAIVGTRISPYLFFWQASQEVEEEIGAGRTNLSQRRGATKRELRYAAWDTYTGMFFANLIFYFIILSAAATLHESGTTEVGSAADAARALRPVAGDAASALFAVGLIGAGFLGVPVLTGGAAYAVAEALGWRHGLDERPARAKEFYAVIAAATLTGLLINFVGINPIDALFYAGLINGLLAPPLLILLLLIANNRAVMGGRVNRRPANVLGWVAVAVTLAAVVGLVLSWFLP